MNAPAEIEGLTTMRRIDPADAKIGQAVAALLQAAGLTVSIAIARRAARNTFITVSGVNFEIRSIDGRAVSLHAERVTDAIQALDRLDPLLARVEGVLGVSLDATDIIEMDEAIAINVDDGSSEITLLISQDHVDGADWVMRAANLPPDVNGIPMPVALSFAGPRLPVSEAAGLASGDLLLVPTLVSASLTAPGNSGVLGAIDLTTGLFRCGDTGVAMSDNPAPAAADFLVPLTIYLPDQAISAASLNGLVTGSTLPLGPLTDGMAVEIRVANQIFARGELVQLGDRFAVLIEQRADVNTKTATENE